MLSNPHIGDVPLPEAVSQFFTGDVFMHTWDLARATGQDDTLDPERCAAMLAGMEPIEDAHARQRAVRPAGRRTGRRGRADQDAGVHRPRSRVETPDVCLVLLVTTTPTRSRATLTGISSRAWEHPADRGALVALRKLKGFDTILKAINGLFNERANRLLFLGSGWSASTSASSPGCTGCWARWAGPSTPPSCRRCSCRTARSPTR